MESKQLSSAMKLTQRIPHPVAINASTLANTSAIASLVKTITSVIAVTSPRAMTPWKKRIQSWKPAYFFGLKENICKTWIFLVNSQ